MNKNKLIAMAIAAALSFPAMQLPLMDISQNTGTFTASAAEVASGECGDNLTWILDDAGTLTISGTGEMTESPWNTTSYKKDVKAVVIEDGVTTIRGYAFSGCTSLTSITIPDSVTEIEYAAFCGCTSLTSITIPDSVTFIGIGSDAFSGTPWIENKRSENPLVIVNNILIDGSTCTGDVVIPEGVTAIGLGTFEGCTSLTSVTIPDSVTSIEGYAFYGCESLTEITIPDSVTEIGDYAFEDCTWLTAIHVSPDNENYTSVDGVLFDKTVQELIYCPRGKKSEYTIPDSVTAIGNWAFYLCESLTEITIPDSVTYIGIYAFEDCTSLTAITIPDSVTAIGEYAFCHCTSLTAINVSSDNENYTSVDGVLFDKTVQELICCPGGKSECTIPDSVTSIGWNAFSGCTSLTSVTIPDSVTSIEGYAFYGCESLTEITIPDSVTAIGIWAFFGCTSLTSITIPDSVTEIENWAFEDCTSLTEIAIPDSVTSIGWNAFSGCTSLTAINVSPDNKKYTSIDGVLFDKPVQELICCPGGKSECTIPDSVTYIGYEAFINCTSLTSVTIPDSVTSIGNYAFLGCDSLTDIYFTGTEEQWNAIEKSDAKIPEAAIIHFNSSAPETNYLVGDADGDGEFGVADVVSFQKWLKSPSDTKLANWKALDFTGDGKLNVFDFCLMKLTLLSEK